MLRISLGAPMIIIFLVQLALPFLLIGWLALFPARSAVGLGAQLAAIALGLLALALTGLWLFPPWWSPYGFAVLYLLAAGFALHRRLPFTSVLPVGAGAYVATFLCVLFGVAAGYRAALAWAGRTPPAAQIVDLRFPLAGGNYLVVNGGNETVVNAHLETLNAAVDRFRAWRGQSYAVDVVKIDDLGLRANGLQPADARAYRIYGEPVLAPCAGKVVAAVDGLPDMRVPEVDRQHMAGNHVTLRCGDIDVLLGHFRPGSLTVGVGRRIATGEQLGTVGNSGNTGEPHLHIHAQRPGTISAPMSGDPLPMRFSGRYLVRGDRVNLEQLPIVSHFEISRPRR